MNCDTCQAELSARNDGQVAPERLAAVEEHICSCSACRSMADELSEMDRQLRACFLSTDTSTKAVAKRVVNQLPLQSVNRTGVDTSSTRWTTALLSAAAGFLGAVLWLQPWSSPLEPSTPSAVISRNTVARVSLTSGSVEATHDDSLEWFQCPSSSRLVEGSRVRTGTDDLCELQTEKDATIRLAAQTELLLENAERFSLEKGRLWCQSAQPQAPLSIDTPNGCVTVFGTCDITFASGTTEILVLEGEASIEGTGERFAAPHHARLASDNVLQHGGRFDPIIATRWIHGLLVQKGVSNNQELERRVSGLLSAIGRSKLNYLYEDEIRALGPSGADPLIAFVRSTANESDERPRRLRASRILGDIAGPSSIPGLIELLPDADGQVRFHAARCLLRLTGRDFRLTPEQWRDMPEEQIAASVTKWTAWLKRIPGKGL